MSDDEVGCGWFALLLAALAMSSAEFARLIRLAGFGDPIVEEVA
jgi:hypothetical protein